MKAKTKREKARREKLEVRHREIMDEIDGEFWDNEQLHGERNYYGEGIHSPEISALVGYLVKKGVVE